MEILQGNNHAYLVMMNQEDQRNPKRFLERLLAELRGQYLNPDLLRITSGQYVHWMDSLFPLKAGAMNELYLNAPTGRIRVEMCQAATHLLCHANTPALPIRVVHVRAWEPAAATDYTEYREHAQAD